MQAVRLKTEHLFDPVGVDFVAPRLYWNCSGGRKQAAYQIVAADDIGSTLWESVTSSTASLASYLLKIGANSTTGVVSSVLDYLSSGANYVCYVNGEQTTYKTSVKYPVLAGGISVRKTASGSVGTMAQLLPVTVDQLGAASVRSGSTRYETADDMQVYLWYKGKYYATTLSQINAEDYSLIGWYDAHGSAAGGKIRVLVAVKKD